MFRVLGAVLAFTLAAPTTALACGMYIPPTKHEATLADVLDSIDAVAVRPAEKPADAKPAAMMNANTEPATATAEATLPSEDEARHGKRHKPSS